MKTSVKITREEWASMGYQKANEILAPMSVADRLEVLQDTPSSMTPFKYWIQKSKAELMQHYMNACVTGSLCLGRTKAELNEQAAEHYLKLMFKFDVPTPPKEITRILGFFNGDGSC